MTYCTIAEEEQELMIDSFWIMLKECEAKAEESNDKVLIMLVESWFIQWNRITNDTKMPRWLTKN